MAREFKDFSVEQLQGYYSDFHKDLNGFRPRFTSDSEWNNKQYLVTQINLLHVQMDYLRETFNGREQLREQGWIIQETDTASAQQAQWLAQERERILTEEMADSDATYYDVA